MTVQKSVEQKILGLFLRNPYASLSIHQIAQRLGKKYPYIHKRTTELIDEGILHKVVVGRSHLCRPKLSNQKTILLLSLLAQELWTSLPIHVQSSLTTYVKELKINPEILFILVHKQDILLVTAGEFQGKVLAPPKPFTLCHLNNTTLAKKLGEKDVMENIVPLYGYERLYEYVSAHSNDLRPHLDPLISTNE